MGIREEAERLKEELNEESKNVRVVLFGQPGAGKSSLINALAGTPVAKVAVTTDTTTEATRYEVNGVEYWDLPGFDTASFPKEVFREKFGVEDYDLFLCVVAGKFREAETDFYRTLVEKRRPLIFVHNKVDALWEEGKTHDQLRTAAEEDIRRVFNAASHEVVMTSCRTPEGLGDLEHAVLLNLDKAKRGRWTRHAKAWSVEWLKGKREACDGLVLRYAALSAANGLNPIPGVDIAIDIGVLLKLFNDIRDAYGLTESKLDRSETFLTPAARETARLIARYATTDGIMFLLKKFATRGTIKQISKYVPFVGQGIAALAGFGITYAAGSAYLADAHTVATEILEQELRGGR